MKYQCSGFSRLRDTVKSLFEDHKMIKCLVLSFFIYYVVGSIVAIEISSKIDFKSDGVPSSDSSSEKPDPVVIVVENSNTDTHKETRGFQSSGSRSLAGGNVSVRGRVKPIRSHSSYPLNTQSARPKVIKNIYIIVNGKTTGKPGNFDCRENICQTNLSTDTDEEGNVIGSVHLTIVTKTEGTKVEDVPVIDGIRGTGYDNRNPTFAHNNGRTTPYPPFLDNIIPQAPMHRQGQVPRRNPFRSQSASFYPRNFGPRTSVWNPWFPSRGSVDDKIAAPLSQTNLSDQ